VANDGGDSRDKMMDAFWRAMSPPRLIDGNVRFADFLHLQRMVASPTASPPGDGMDWDVAAEMLGDRAAAKARGHVDAGESPSAINSFRAAVAIYSFAQMPLVDSDRKRDLYQKIRDAMTSLCAIPEARTIRVEVPFNGRLMIGWLVMPAGELHGAVVTFGGQSGWGAVYMKNALTLADRGIATLLAEGPGQGETRLEQGVYLDVDVPAAYGAFIDVLDDLIPAKLANSRGRKPLGIWGNSLGGLFAATTAAREPRIAACCVNSGIASPRLRGMRTFDEQAEQMLGTQDAELITRNFERISFTQDMRISSDLLVLHGTADPIVDLEDIQLFYDAGDPDRRTFTVWEGGDHALYNHGDERNDLVADWFLRSFTS